MMQDNIFTVSRLREFGSKVKRASKSSGEGDLLAEMEEEWSILGAVVYDAWLEVERGHLQVDEMVRKSRD